MGQVSDIWCFLACVCLPRASVNQWFCGDVCRGRRVTSGAACRLKSWRLLDLNVFRAPSMPGWLP